MTPTEALAVAAIGLGGGICGGLLGIGGSIVMIPLLGITLGPNQQLYQASCMMVNVVVAVGSVRRHLRAGSVRPDCFRWMLPVSMIAVVTGVLISNRVPSHALQMLFGVFLLYVAASEVWRMLHRGTQDGRGEERVSAGIASTVGGATGLLAGLLGIGGGTIAVPLLRSLAQLPLRQAIGTSAAVMTLASAVGAIAKNIALPSLTAPDGSPLTLAMSLSLALLLAPTAWIGATLGAKLTYALPLFWVRGAFVLLLFAAGVRMLL